MRFFSNAESVDNAEISLLAIAETIAAISISAWVAVKYGTMLHIALGASLAPLLLLRTQKSVLLGVAWLDLVWNKIREIANREQFGLASFLVIPAVFAPIPIRIAATLTGLATMPLVSISAIPSNWFRTAMCLDSARPPEVVPGYEKLGAFVGLHFHPMFGDLKMIRGNHTKQEAFWIRLAVLFIAVIVFLPSMFYRLSLKSTSIVYLPFLWISWAATQKFDDFPSVLKRRFDSDYATIVTWYSLIVVACFLTKFAFMALTADFADWWNDTRISRFLAVYIIPSEIPLWQLAAAINATLVLISFLYAKRVLEWFEVAEKMSAIVFRVLDTVRAVLTLYTIACTLYITFEAVDHIEFPKFGTEWFPWS